MITDRIKLHSNFFLPVIIISIVEGEIFALALPKVYWRPLIKRFLSNIYGKRQFVPHDQVFPLFDVYSLLCVPKY